MVKVVIFGSLQAATDGLAEVEVEAGNFKTLLEQLELKYPALAEPIATGVSVAIDGLIYREAWFTPIKPDSEVVLMPFMVGG